MANKNFEVRNGLTVGSSTIDATTGKVTATSLVTANAQVTGGSISGTPISGSSGSFTTGTFSSTLGVTGATTIAGLSATTGTFSSTLGVTGAATLGSTLGVTGAATLSSTLGVTGLITSTGGISGGSATHTTGTFSSTLGVTGATTIAGLSATTGTFSSTLGVTGATTIAGLSATTGTFSSTLGVTGATTLAGLTATSITIPSITKNGTNNSGDIGQSNNVFATIYATAFVGVSTTAKYADLAENYQADKSYSSGTVLMFGGAQEVTLATEDTTAVAGIVSTNPAHLMNGALAGANVVAVALIGRVPCNVIGPVKKGDLMISAGFGFAKASINPTVGQVIGKALSDFTGAKGQIEIVIGIR